MRPRVSASLVAAGAAIALIASACGSSSGRESATPSAPAAGSAAASATAAALDSLNQKLAQAGEPTVTAPGESATPALPAVPPPTLGPEPTPTPCGPQPGADMSIAVQEQYGPARNCGRYGTRWVLTTLGKPQQGVPGVIAVFDCAPGDQGCLDGGQAVSGSWQSFPTPAGGGVAILTYHAPELLLSGGICFNLETREFNTSPTCGEAP